MNNFLIHEFCVYTNILTRLIDKPKSYDERQNRMNPKFNLYPKKSCIQLFSEH